MRVTGTIACLLVALGLGPATAAAQPDGRLDVEPIITALNAGERIIRAPGTVARFDEARVRAELGTDGRLVVLPYVDYELYRDENDESRYYELVREPILDWALDREVPVVLVTGLDVTMFGGGATLDHRLPADLAELRTTVATRVITERLVVFARLGRGYSPDAAENVEYHHPDPVPAPPGRVAELIAALRKDRIHNAPGREEPIEDWVAEDAADEHDLNVRIAAFPGLAPGRPVVDYATPLGKAFPDEVVLVLHGDWLDIVAPDQRKALAARAFVYGDADLSMLTAAGNGNRVLARTVERLDLLLTETAWGHPQPPPQPRPQPFDVQRAVSALAPWVLVGSAVVLGGAGMLRHRTRAAAMAAAEERALRAESASAMAAISDAGAVDPAAAERHASARLLYDQAHTSAAMVEVRRIAEEGLALTEPEPVAPPADTERKGKRRRATRKKAR
ncbi:hypothetical protein [Actinophytocola gossypii]|uniref:DUF4350 domain-containing protein n=1 Tax=Actinophytocola gossypii TaxID=2812003 RepID=A0ABT2J206_9PSEU|nr:hypothetical protein [Actinophytocola gossypii]MCT2581879.1 hypothetical protein [Actinophytocola gossypii]